MAMIGYLRVSSEKQEIESQKLAILEYADQQNLKINEWSEHVISSRKSAKERGIDKLLERLKSRDVLIVSELSRLGRSVGQVIMIIDELLKQQIDFIAIKENILLKDGKRDIASKITITLMSLFAELERDLISMRTKEGLKKAREKGKLLGRPKGSYSSQLDSKLEEIKELLALGVSKRSIAKIVGVAPSTLYEFLKRRKLI